MKKMKRCELTGPGTILSPRMVGEVGKEAKDIGLSLLTFAKKR